MSNRATVSVACETQAETRNKREYVDITDDCGGPELKMIGKPRIPSVAIGHRTLS